MSSSLYLLSQQKSRLSSTSLVTGLKLLVHFFGFGAKLDNSICESHLGDGEKMLSYRFLGDSHTKTSFTHLPITDGLRCLYKIPHQLRDATCEVW